MSGRLVRRLRVGLATLLGAGGVTILVPAVMSPAVSAGDISVTTHIARTFYDAVGAATESFSRDVTVKVSSTENLRGRQNIAVSWTGARPTGGLVDDPNSGDAAGEEFPMVLLQCRGTQQTVTPETCWTSTSRERFTSDGNTKYPAWRVDALAPDAERAQRVGEPTPRPSACNNASLTERWVPFKAAGDTVFAGGPGGCAGVAPEASNLGNTGLPSNTTYATTGAGGSGSTRFNVLTADENASLGCSAQVACSLVAVPIVGISCDAWGTRLTDRTSAAVDAAATQADSVCRAAPRYAPGELASTAFDGNLADSGVLWWSASNWSNRIVVPLGFAVSPKMCAVVNPTAPIAVYGSVLMNEITAQWAPKFCTDDAYKPFNHVQAPDPAARNVITAGTAPMAFSSLGDETGYAGKPVVQAPVALTGWGVGYAVDDKDGSRVSDLKLSARLIAKLLTESYYGNNLVRDSYPALAGNPANITMDPEFQKLNPDVPASVYQITGAALQFLSNDADMVWGLTSYLDDDPDARAFLDGKADPWGMTVNPSYKGIELPATAWPALDDFKLPQSYIDSNNNPCYSYSPSPYMALIANPTGFISTIVQNLQYAISAVSIQCNGTRTDVSSLKMQTIGRQTPGSRFVLGLAPLTAAHRYDFEVARLQTTNGTFVAGDDAGLKAGAALLQHNDATTVWELAWDKLATAAGASAYPGTMPVYGDAPTTGLDAGTAGRVAQLLTYAVEDGQTPGTGLGQLPPGALPLTATNGLGDLAAYTRLAADAVRTQSGQVPPPWVVAMPATSGVGSAAKPPKNSAATPPAGAVVPAIDVPAAAVPAAAVAAGSSPATVDASDLRTVGASSAFGRIGLPAAMTAALLFALAGLVLRTSVETWVRSYALVRRGGVALVALASRGGGRRRSR